MPSPSAPNASQERSAFPQRFGRFVLLRELGQGGMGQVFMGVSGQAGLERVCALKIIKDLTRDRETEDLGQRFLDEAKVATKLSHENLVYVFDFGLVRSQGYLAMEYVQGKTLTEVWNRCAQRSVGFPLGVSLFLMTELCGGLGYAHQVGGLGLVHRDVSPSNVMLSYTGGIKLIDFGLAKWKSKVAQTATGINWGKMSYMSPEQYLGRPLDRRSDLFSAGVILWELLTGRQLFPGSGTRAREPEIVAPSKINGNLFAELDTIVMKALAFDPKDRFQSGEEMSAALAAHLPRESGKLEVAEFLRGLFGSDIDKEQDEQERLVASAAALKRAPATVVGAGGGAGFADADFEDVDPLVGAILGDRYYVRRLVGEGAMGRVYEGHHTGVGKRVALKVPRRPERRRAELLQRFRLEANAASQIGHPNIADVTDCGTAPDGSFFFVMEFIDGIDLDKLVRREGPMPLERGLLIALQIARALEAAHKAGIIHRDLKPSNVMIVRGREEPDFVKVLDFGVAKFLRAEEQAAFGEAPANLTLTDAAVGTPRYMAPEQIEAGREIDFRADIYALGGILFYMLSGGRAPHEGDSVENVWRKKVLEDPTPLGRWRSDLPPVVEELVMRCLARDPASRPASMEELKRAIVRAEELLRAAGSSVLGMRVPSSTTLVGDSAPTASDRRRRTTILVSGAAAAVVVGALALKPWRGEGDERRPAGRASAGLVATATEAPSRAPNGVDLDRASHSPSGRAALGTPTKIDRDPPSPPSSQPVEVPFLANGEPRAAKGALGASPSEQGAPATEPVASSTAPLPEGQGRRAPLQPTRRLAVTPRPEPRAGADEAKIFLERADLHFHEEDYGRAIELATAVLQSAPDAATKVRALLLLGKSHRSAGQPRDAKSAYERAQRLDPTSAAARDGLRRTEREVEAGEGDSR